MQQLDRENKILKEERKEMLKMHEDSMKALQDSASAEINRLKEELAILKDQNQAADEKNQCHSEAFKLLQQEKESLADIVWQAKASIFSKFPPPCIFVVWILRVCGTHALLVGIFSAYGFNPLASFRQGMHGSCRQLHQHRDHPSQGDCQAPPDIHQGLRLRDEVLGDSAPSPRACYELESFMCMCWREDGALNGEGTLRRCRHRHGDLWYPRR